MVRWRKVGSILGFGFYFTVGVEMPVFDKMEEDWYSVVSTCYPHNLLLPSMVSFFLFLRKPNSFSLAHRHTHSFPMCTSP